MGLNALNRLLKSPVAIRYWRFLPKLDLLIAWRSWMPRRNKPERRQVPPDARYNSVEVQSFHQPDYEEW